MDVFSVGLEGGQFDPAVGLGLLQKFLVQAQHVGTPAGIGKGKILKVCLLWAES